MSKNTVPSVGGLTDVHTTQQNPLGLEVGDGQGGVYKYLKGVANCVVGSWVNYDELGVTALAVADAVGPMAIAMAAIVAGDFGWFCVVSPEAGVTGACKASMADNSAPYLTSTAGQVDDAAVAGDSVFGAIARSAEASNLATFQINRPQSYNGAYLV